MFFLFFTVQMCNIQRCCEELYRRSDINNAWHILSAAAKIWWTEELHWQCNGTNVLYNICWENAWICKIWNCVWDVHLIYFYFYCPTCNNVWISITMFPLNMSIVDLWFEFWTFRYNELAAKFELSYMLNY